MFTSTRDAEELLRNASLRVTSQRSAVLHLLGQHPHVDEAEVTFWGTRSSCSETTDDGAYMPSTTKENI